MTNQKKSSSNSNASGFKISKSASKPVKAGQSVESFFSAPQSSSKKKSS